MYLTDALLTNILHTIMSIAPQQSPTDINVLSYLANYMESDYRWPIIGQKLRAIRCINTEVMYYVHESVLMHW